MKILHGFLAITLTTASTTNLANDLTWYIKPTFGISVMSDQSGQVTDVLEQTGSADINLDSGFNAGLGVGYEFNDNWAVELYWEYRTNDSETILPGGLSFTEGNFASSMFAANAYYYLQSDSQWQWFVGAGLAVLQEVDVDLEDETGERSFSGSGDVGFQIFTGVDYKINERWSAQGEIRYLSVTGIDMSAEENVITGVFEDFDYTPISAQFNLIYRF